MTRRRVWLAISHSATERSVKDCLKLLTCGSCERRTLAMAGRRPRKSHLQASDFEPRGGNELPCPARTGQPPHQWRGRCDGGGRPPRQPPPPVKTPPGGGAVGARRGFPPSLEINVLRGGR